MNWSPPPTIDPQITTIATGLIGAISGYLAARMGVKMKEVEKEPEIMKHLDSAVANIISHYTKALEQEKVRHAEHVARHRRACHLRRRHETAAQIAAGMALETGAGHILSR